jgi:hypothetical protein
LAGDESRGGEIPILTFRVICLYGGGLGMYLLARLGGLVPHSPQ